MFFYSVTIRTQHHNNFCFVLSKKYSIEILRVNLITGIGFEPTSLIRFFLSLSRSCDSSHLSWIWNWSQSRSQSLCKFLFCVCVYFSCIVRFSLSHLTTIDLCVCVCVSVCVCPPLTFRGLTSYTLILIQSFRIFPPVHRKHFEIQWHSQRNVVHRDIVCHFL